MTRKPKFQALFAVTLYSLVVACGQSKGPAPKILPVSEATPTPFSQNALPTTAPLPPDSEATVTDGPTNPSAATALNALVGGNGVKEYQYA